MAFYFAITGLKPSLFDQNQNISFLPEAPFPALLPFWHNDIGKSITLYTWGKSGMTQLRNSCGFNTELGCRARVLFRPVEWGTAQSGLMTKPMVLAGSWTRCLPAFPSEPHKQGEGGNQEMAICDIHADWWTKRVWRFFFKVFTIDLWCVG